MSAEALADLVAGLSQPGVLVPGAEAEVVETGLSVVFLAGGRAWKIKKPIRLWGLVDYGDLEARRRACEQEVRLNRRLAPDVYLGVVPVVRTETGYALGGAGAVVEHAVEMARLPPGLTLRERLEARTIATEDVEDAGRALAAFHEEHGLDGAPARNALPSRFGDVVRRNFAASEGGVPEPFPERVHEGVRVRMVRRLAQARTLLRARVRSGRIVDGHGDVRLEHVVRWPGAARTVFIDCCEFTDRLRHIDPLSDAAFLSVDLTARGRPDLARAFEAAYLDRSGDPDAAALLPLFRAYRAHVGAMTDLRVHDRGLSARRNLALAWRYARTGAVPPVIVLRGAAGTGKSYLATEIAPWLGAEPIRSDWVRKELLGMALTDRPDDAQRAVVYGGPMHVRTYAAVLDRAREAVGRGRAVLLDATYLLKKARREAQDLAASLGAPYAVLDVRCDAEIVRKRLQERAARGDDASDADWRVYTEQVAGAEPVAGAEAAFHVPFESGRPAEECILPLVDVLESQVDARLEILGTGETP